MRILLGTVCLIAALANVPWMLQGQGLSFIAFSVCGGIALWHFARLIY